MRDHTGWGAVCWLAHLDTRWWDWQGLHSNLLGGAELETAILLSIDSPFLSLGSFLSFGHGGLLLEMEGSGDVGVGGQGRGGCWRWMEGVEMWSEVGELGGGEQGELQRRKR